MYVRSLARVLTTTTISLTTLSALAMSQEILVSQDVPNLPWFGHRTAVIIEDLDGDLVPDIVAGSGGGNEAYVVSGATGSTIYSLTAPDPAMTTYGWSVGVVGDVDGDMTQDFIVSARWINTTEVRSGATGLLIYDIPHSASGIAGIEDHDGDGVDDIAMVDQGSLFLVSGATGLDILPQWVKPDGVRLYYVGSAGDVNADGVEDLVTGQIDWAGQGPGKVRVHSGVDLSPLWTNTGVADGDSYGSAVLGGEDLNGDGVPDVIACATSSHDAGSDYVRVLSGVDGSLIREEVLPADIQYGDVWLRVGLEFIPDMDGDGVADYVIGGAGHSLSSVNGTVEYRSGATGAWIQSTSGGPGYGITLRATHDWNGDGGRDLLIIQDSWDFALSDGYEVRRLGEIGTPYCAVTANSTGAIGRLRAWGEAEASASLLTLVADQLPTNEFGFYLMGQVQAATPIAQGVLCITNPIVRLDVGPGSVLNSGPGGVVERTVDLTSLPQGIVIQPGDIWNFQLWHRDFDVVTTTNSMNFSPGLEVAFQ